MSPSTAGAPKISRNLLRELNHKRIDAGRTFLLKVMRFLFDRSPLQRPLTEGVRNILVLRLDGKLGDCITSTGVFAALHKAFPAARITVLTPPQTASIYKAFPFLEVVTVKKGLGGTLKAWFLLRHQQFDVSVNTSHIMIARTVFLMANIKSHKKISFNCPDFPLFTDHAVFDALTDHVTTRYRRVMEILGHSEADLSYQLPIPSQAIATADAQLKILGGSPFIVINSFAGARFRNFSQETTVALVQHFRKLYPDHKVVSIGNWGDLNILKEWQKKHQIESWFVFPECGDLFVNCRIIERSNLVVSPDTAVVHIACALKKDLIAVFRADTTIEKNSQIWAPFGCRHKVIYSVPQPEMQEEDINKFAINEVFFEKI